MTSFKAFSIPFFLLLIIATGLLSACGRIQNGQTESTDAIRIDLTVEPAQPSVGPAKLVVRLTNDKGQPINNATLDIEGNMTHAGMTPVLAQAVGGQNGRYEVPFEWTMGGDWIVTVKATLDDGRVSSGEFPVVVN